MTTSTSADLKRKIAARHAELDSWAKVAAEYPGVKRGTLQRFATNGYEPKDAKIRKALGLPVIVTAPAPVCPKCGIVHAHVCKQSKMPPAWEPLIAYLKGHEQAKRCAEVRVYGKGGRPVDIGSKL